jgi:hypothetical protein
VADVGPPALAVDHEPPAARARSGCCSCGSTTACGPRCPGRGRSSSTASRCWSAGSPRTTRPGGAGRGRAAGGGWARGYELHAVVGACGAVGAFRVTPPDAGEATVARDVLPWSGACDLGGATLLADANYDPVALYAAVADAGGRLLAPRRKPGTGLGHHAPSTRTAWPPPRPWTGRPWGRAAAAGRPTACGTGSSRRSG